MMPSITSSAPPPIEVSRLSRYMREISLSLMKPVPPQYCWQRSVTSRAGHPAFSLAVGELQHIAART